MSQLADVAIIGGGIIGTATAAALAAAGVRVTLYEMGPTVASAASGRNAGLVMEPSDPVVAGLFRESLARYRELEGEPLGDGSTFGLPASPMDVLALAFDGDLVRRVAAAAGGSPELLEGGALRGLEPLLAEGLTGFRLATGYPVRPADATRAFAAVAMRLGATIRANAAVRPWVEGGVARGVEVDGRRIPAGHVVVAAGPWTPELVDPSGRWQPIRPLWGFLVELDLPSPPRHVLEELTSDDSLLFSGPPPTGGDGLPPRFFTMNPAPIQAHGGAAPTALGNALALVEPDPSVMTPRLLAHGRRFVPSIEERHVRGTRLCPRPLAFDGRPLIGFVPGIERLVVAAGNGAFGISTGPATGRLAAEVVLTGNDAGVPRELVAGRAVT